MPRCFQLTKNGANAPSTLVSVDEELCKHFNQPVDKRLYLWWWYDTIGLRLACGESFHSMLNGERKLEDENLRKVAEYLSENYTANSWWEAKY